MRSIVEIGGNVPAFLGKLWKLVNDSATNNLISWSPGGKTFLIQNQAEFARELLPLYYKHSNMASFIRQLNMYGFHKVTSVENGGLKCDKDEIEFTHPYFVKGHAYLLENIKRKIANPKSVLASTDGDKIMLKPELMNKVLLDVKQMKGRQESMDARFSVMKTENEALWREVAVLRQKHMKQQQIVNNLIQFLMSLVQPPRSSNVNSGVGVKRRYQLMINNAAHNNGKVDDSSSAKNPRLSADLEEDEDHHEEQNEETMDDGPTIHELAHDDLLMSEAAPEQEMDVTNAQFISIEVPPIDSAGTILVPSNDSGSAQYHVTMVDGDETNLDDARIGDLGTNGGMLSPSALSPLINSPPSVVSEQINPSSVSPTPNVLVNNTVSMPSNSSQNKAQLDSARKLNETNIFNVKSSPINLNMPADIFAGDDIIAEPEVSLSDVNKQAEISSATQSSALTYVTQSPLRKDKLLNTQPLNAGIQKSITQGSYNAKALSNSDKSKHNLKKNRPSKKATTEQPLIIKTESVDENDWANMTLATVDNNLDIGKLSSMRDYIMNGTDDKASRMAGYKNKGDVDDHLETMQSDLDSLRELLRGDNYSLDANTLYGNTNTEDGSMNRPSFPDPRLHFNYEGGLKLFGQDDLFYGLSMNNVEDKTNKTNSNADAENQMISYITPLLDFDEFSLSNVNGENSQSALSPTPPDDNSVLNTPQISFTEPPFQ